MLNDIAQDPNAKLFQIVDKEAVINMINTQGRSFTKPWFGQLMTGPQVIAYLIQLETWLNEYNVKLDI
jgi:asparagine synthase (glutamine-hydrolysing)